MTAVSTEVVTIADARFFELMRVAFGSLRSFGGLPDDAKLAVYDFGLKADQRASCQAMGIDIRRIEAPYPAAVWALERRFALWVAKTWAIWDAARWPQDSRSVVIFFDTDMAVLDVPQASDYCQRVIEAALSADGPVAVPDLWTFQETTMYALDGDDARDANFWTRWFNCDLRAAMTWNIGLIAGRPEVLRGLYAPWQSWVLKWGDPDSTLAQAFSPVCIDQLAFSALSATGVFGHPMALPVEMNFTRPMWTKWPERIRDAQAIHLTGAIKPWQAAGVYHPMTLRWKRVADKLGVTP